MDTNNWCIGEAVKPKSKLTSLASYEEEMNRKDKPVVVRVWRVPEEETTIQEREAVETVFLETCLGLPYPLSVLRMWVFRFVNSLPWKIEGPWCTRLVWDPWESVCPGVFDKPHDQDQKKNPTPRTFENRLVAGVIQDATDQVIVWKDGRLVFDRTKMMPGDIIAVRTHTTFGELIQGTLGSFTSHNGLAVRGVQE